MGEVYRADDLDLGESVALKFLPQRVACNPAWLARFRNEVRVARQIAHPNVCRVYDIGEADGQLFLSMEYIDGEDLASVLRRMGRPSRDKAVEIARQLCLGLGAAHDRGVLHRDLKPANVMIDGRGRVRITDFGLAGFVDEIGELPDRAGTPAYMAPEQLASGTVSTRSDIFSLGLVLYEIFTGRSAFETDDVSKLKQLHESGTLKRPSALASDIDPPVARLILRCLEKDPRERPPSVYAVLGALPGGDPLAAVLAAGETPSPELVANAGEAGGLSSRAALACAGAVATLLVAGTLATQGRNLVPAQPPDVLAVKAAELLERLGYADLPRLSASGFMLNEALLGELKRRGEGWGRLADDRLPVFLFWRRWSADTLLPVGQHAMLPEHENPPQRAPGSATVLTNTRGRLVSLKVVPRESQPPDPESRTDWSILFREAGFDPSALRPMPPLSAPPNYCDEVAAWAGELPGDPSWPVGIRAGGFLGRPIHFAIDWNGPGSSQAPAAGASTGTGTVLSSMAFLWPVAILTALVMALRNLRLGRGDRRGALWLAMFVFLVYFVCALVVAPLSELGFTGLADSATSDRILGHALLHALQMWLCYLAVEPYVRRLWPRMLVGWARLVSGRLRDPLVGTEVVAGSVVAVALWALSILGTFVSRWLGLPAPPPIHGWARLLSMSGLDGLLYVLLIASIAATCLVVMTLLVELLVLRLITRRTWAAVVGAVLLSSVTYVAYLVSEPQVPLAFRVAYFVLPGAATVFLLLRFGLVAALVGNAMHLMLIFAPLTLDPASWYIDRSLIVLGIVAAVVGYGFYTSLAGRPIFRDAIREPATAAR